MRYPSARACMAIFNLPSDRWRKFQPNHESGLVFHWRAPGDLYEEVLACLYLIYDCICKYINIYLYMYLYIWCSVARPPPLRGWAWSFLPPPVACGGLWWSFPPCGLCWRGVCIHDRYVIYLCMWKNIYIYI